MNFKKYLVLALGLLVSVFAINGIARSAPPGVPSSAEISKYLIIAMGGEDVKPAVKMSNGEFGADQIVLSTSDSNGCPGGRPNLYDVFKNRYNLTTTPADSLDEAADLFEGVDHTGEIALTSANGKFDAANVVIFAQTGFVAANASPVESKSGSKYSAPGGLANCSNAVDISENNGWTGGNDLAPVLAELTVWKEYIEDNATGLGAAEYTISSDITGSEAVNGAGGNQLKIDASDTNNDGVVVIDIKMKGETFDVDTDWILGESGDKLYVFRILDAIDMKISDASIMLDKNYETGSGTIHGSGIGAIFYHASGDDKGTIMGFNNTVINGIGFWDLNAVGEGGSNTKTYLDYQDSQGCGQFIGQAIIFSNARWSRCSEELTPVELASFSAIATPEGVQIDWATATEIDNAGFNVYRGSSPIINGSEQVINQTLIAAQGTLGQGASYRIVDDGVTPGAWFYFLEDIDTSGNSTFHGPAIVDTSVPTSTSLTETDITNNSNSMIFMVSAVLIAGVLVAASVVLRKRYHIM